MSIEMLDQIVPAIMFIYGTVLFLTLDVFSLPQRIRIEYNDYYSQLKLHQNLSRLCFFVGGAWLVQNLLV